MSDERTPANAAQKNDTSKKDAAEAKGNPFILQMKDAALLMGWIGGLVLIAGLCWFFTQPVRNRFLIRAVNQVLEQSGDSRRLGDPVAPGASKAGFPGIGSWYTMAGVPEGTRAFVFVLIGEGIFFPCAAVVSPGGKVEEFIPLNSHGEKMIKRVSRGILEIYTRRIEGAES